MPLYIICNLVFIGIYKTNIYNALYEECLQHIDDIPLHHFRLNLTFTWVMMISINMFWFVIITFNKKICTQKLNRSPHVRHASSCHLNRLSQHRVNRLQVLLKFEVWPPSSHISISNLTIFSFFKRHLSLATCFE